MPSNRKSIRIPDYDYSQSGYYFITLVTYQRQLIFGDINSSGEMLLNTQGIIASYEWKNLQRDFGIEIDEFVVMPNHLHGILIIKESNNPSPSSKIAGPAPGSIGMLIGQYKSQVTRLIRKDLNDPNQQIWQRNYYERIIRSEDDLSRIRHYILDNPLRWAEDDYNRKGDPPDTIRR